VELKLSCHVTTRSNFARSFAQYATLTWGKVVSRREIARQPVSGKVLYCRQIFSNIVDQSG
jgi:hypothetical protein